MPPPSTTRPIFAIALPPYIFRNAILFFVLDMLPLVKRICKPHLLMDEIISKLKICESPEFVLEYLLIVFVPKSNF